jgi:hypothetical protein
VYITETFTENKNKTIGYSKLVLPALLHGSENWAIKATGARTITEAEMIHMRKIPGYTWTD